MEAESAAKMLENISEGIEVKIERRRTGKIFEGKIIEILDDEPYNEDGIEVKIEGNYSGNVKEILREDEIISVQELREKIANHEAKDFEMKSSFKYDVNISNKGIGQFVNQDVDVVYWISAEAQFSTVSK